MSEGRYPTQADGRLGVNSDLACRSLAQPLYQLYEITFGILDDEFALAYFYIFSLIPSVFAISIEWTSSLTKCLDNGCDSLNIEFAKTRPIGSTILTNCLPA
ncbi:MAG: hypothetical protein JWQ69_3619 [Pseudomonas sp.]|nr:hypothetical protein [Pseudomonas sp.]